MKVLILLSVKTSAFTCALEMIRLEMARESKTIFFIRKFVIVTNKTGKPKLSYRLSESFVANSKLEFLRGPQQQATTPPLTRPLSNLQKREMISRCLIMG